MPDQAERFKINFCADCGRPVRQTGGHIHRRFSPVESVEVVRYSDYEKLEAHCKAVEAETAEMVDDTVDAWVDRLDTFEGRLRAEVKSRMQRVGNSSSIIAADVEAAIDVAKAAVRVTGAGSPSQVLARQWQSRAEKAEHERDEAVKQRDEELDLPQLRSELQRIAEGRMALDSTELLTWAEGWLLTLSMGDS